MSGPGEATVQLTIIRRCASPELTENERAWIEFLRLASCDSDPAPTLERVQALRQILKSPNAFCRPNPKGQICATQHLTA